jgi:hypothetical protein
VEWRSSVARRMGRVHHSTRPDASTSVTQNGSQATRTWTPSAVRTRVSSSLATEAGIPSRRPSSIGVSLSGTPPSPAAYRRRTMPGAGASIRALAMRPGAGGRRTVSASVP